MTFCQILHQVVFWNNYLNYFKIIKLSEMHRDVLSILVDYLNCDYTKIYVYTTSRVKYEYAYVPISL